MIFSTLDILGTVAFAISGSLAAINKRLDFFGVLIIALATAIGGGTLRDLLIGNTPVTWLTHVQTFYIILGSAFVAMVFRKKLRIFSTSLFLFDTIGLGIFTLVGIEKGLSVDLDPVICILLGTITACFGGVTRDILCNEIPVIFRKEIYATACIVGGIMFFILKYFSINSDFIYIATVATIILMRILAVKYKWSYPQMSE